MGTEEQAIDLRSEPGAPLEVVDLVSDAETCSDADSIVDLTLTPRRRRKRRQHKDRRKDWTADNLAPGVGEERGPAYVYVLENDRSHVYTGSWRDATGTHAARAAADAIASAHNSGTRRSTKFMGPWTVKCLVGPFMTRSAAFKFESLVKSRGSKKGLAPKVKAAHRAVLGARPPKAARGVRVEVF